MDRRKKNIVLAVLIGIVAIGLYVYAIYRVMTEAGAAS